MIQPTFVAKKQNSIDFMDGLYLQCERVGGS